MISEKESDIMVSHFTLIYKTLKWLILDVLYRALQEVLELVATILYREMLKRNTLMPMMRIIKADKDPELQRSLLREWVQTKSNESSYIQLAGGFLFTTVASCLQWPGTQTGHWTAAALFYSSILFALIAIVSGSQQLLLLPNDRRPAAPRENTGTSQDQLPQQVLLKNVDRHDSELDETEKDRLHAIAERLANTRFDDRPNGLQVFALQTPIMLLSLAVVAFLAGLASVVFGPLARREAWDDNAKIATVVGALAA